MVSGVFPVVLWTASPCNKEVSEVRRFPLAQLPTDVDPIDRRSIDAYLRTRP
jgi:hypothetical protein